MPSPFTISMMSISPLEGQQALLSGIIQCAGQIPAESFRGPSPPSPPGSRARTQARVRPFHDCLPMVCTAPLV